MGPIYYKIRKKSELKPFTLLFSCNITKAAHIELVPNLTTAESIKSFKRLISRGGKLIWLILIILKLSRQRESG